MEPLVVGSTAPAFSAPDQDGHLVSLADFKERTLVLYFYPKDDTPGCTVQACSFRDEYSSFIDKGASVLGISPDTAQSHSQFIKKFSLPFPLLSDLTHKMAQDYGVWVEKSMYGRKYMGMERTTFVIDGHGVITAVHRKVKPADHVLELLAAF